MKTYKIKIISPERHLYTGEIGHLMVKNSIGYFGIKAHHAPFVTTLVESDLQITTEDGEKEIFSVSGGCLEFIGSECTILTDSAEPLDEIDLNRAKESREKSLELIQSGTERLQEEAESALRIAENRIRVVEKFRDI